MQKPPSSCPAALAAFALALICGPAPALELDQPLKFLPGSDKMRAQFKAIPQIAGLLAGDFAAAAQAPGPTPAKLAATATAGGPDVLGMRVGQASTAQVRQALGSLSPHGHLDEQPTVLTFQATGIPSTPVAGGHYISGMQYTSTPGGMKCEPTQQCELISTVQSRPPRDVLIGISRQTKFPPTPADTYLGGLTGKYGQPSFREDRVDKSVSLMWVWDADGQLIPKVDRTSFCRQAGLTDAGIISPSSAERWLGARCGTVLRVDYSVRNDLVSVARMYAVAVAATAEAATDTDKFVRTFGDKFLKGKRDAAAANGAPRN